MCQSHFLPKLVLEFDLYTNEYGNYLPTSVATQQKSSDIGNQCHKILWQFLHA